MTHTCAVCEGECFETRFGLCTRCLKEWSITGTYCESTPTGTYHLPEWIRVFAREHSNDERRKYHQEISFAWAFPTGEYEGVYIEPRYDILDEKYRKIEHRGRPRKVHGEKVRE